MQQLDFGFDIVEPAVKKIEVFGTSRITVVLQDPERVAFEHLNFCLRQLAETTQIITDPASDKLAIAEAERLGELYDDMAVNAREEYEVLKESSVKKTAILYISVQDLGKEEDFQFIRVSNLVNNKYQDYCIQDRSDWEDLAISKAFVVDDSDGNIIAETATLKAAVNKAKKDAVKDSIFRDNDALCNIEESLLISETKGR